MQIHEGAQGTEYVRIANPPDLVLFCDKHKYVQQTNTNTTNIEIQNVKQIPTPQNSKIMKDWINKNFLTDYYENYIPLQRHKVISLITQKTPVEQEFIFGQVVKT